MKLDFLGSVRPIIFVFLLGLPVVSVAETTYHFNPHFILTDEELTNYTSLSAGQIDQFLVDQKSGLAGRTLPDANDIARPAAMIVWQAAQEYKINPQVLLTTLQKEQSLISDPNPSQNQLNKAMGYRCPDGGSCAAAAATFGKQIDGAAWQFRQYIDSPQRWNFQSGNNYLIDGYFITPINHATAGLYNYTPHYSGNERFWRLWLQYWGKNYPDGSLVKLANDPGVWLIQYGSRRPITSWGALVSRFDPKKILPISKTDLEKYDVGTPISLYNYSLLRLPNGKIYFLVDDVLRHIESEQVFRSVGFNPEEVVDIDFFDIGGYTIGEPITLHTAYPTGALLQNKDTGGVFYVKDGIKRPIIAPEIMTTNYPHRVITPVNAEELAAYDDGQPVLFRDGELIQAAGSSQVYVIANGQRHWIANETEFEKFGYAWDNVIVTSQAAVDVHPLGGPLE